MVPPAPGRGSITTCCPRISVILAPNRRAGMSGPGPTITRINRLGYSCAGAAQGGPSTSAPSAAARQRPFARTDRVISLLPAPTSAGAGAIELAAGGGDIERIKTLAAETAAVRPVGG